MNTFDPSLLEPEKFTHHFSYSFNFIVFDDVKLFSVFHLYCIRKMNICFVECIKRKRLLKFYLSMTYVWHHSCWITQIWNMNLSGIRNVWTIWLFRIFFSLYWILQSSLDKSLIISSFAKFILKKICFHLIVGHDAHWFAQNRKIMTFQLIIL